MRLILAGLFASALLLAQRPVPIIFDTDIGDDIDDALALALALQSPELDVRAVTTVIDDVELRTRLAWKQLGLYGRRDIPLATGASEPLLDSVINNKSRQYEVLTEADAFPPAARKNAATLIVETLMASNEKLTLVPVGPLTNIALALKTEARIREKIERIVLMGGAFFPPRSEYNIRRDRVAAEIVFRSGVPIVAVGLDVTTKCKLQGADLEKLRAARNPASELMVRLIELWQNGKPGVYPTLHDPLAVAATARGSVIEMQLGEVQVETASPLTFGITVFTPAERLKRTVSTHVARDVNVRGFLDLFVERLSASPRKR
jgi:purine nucleosidase/pyrimidine-specific ribonucleoside hydrolase